MRQNGRSPASLEIATHKEILPNWAQLDQVRLAERDARFLALFSRHRGPPSKQNPLHARALREERAASRPSQRGTFSKQETAGKPIRQPESCQLSRFRVLLAVAR